MKNVLFVISTLTGGGAERTVSVLSQALAKNVKCSVLLNSVSETDYPFCGNVISLGMKPQVKKTLLYQAMAAVKRFFALKKIKEVGNYDAVISFMESANYLNVITGKKDNCKVILSVRNVLSEEYKGIWKFLLFLVRIIYKKADLVVSLSKGASCDLIDNLGVPFRKVTTIYNGYDLSKVVSGSNRGTTQFITMGRLEHQKGQWHLIRAFSKVVSRHPEAKLVILGRGKLEGYFRKMIEELDLNENIEMIGFVKNPAEYLQSSDCFVFPSIYEGFGNSIIEAMINGLPVIACDFAAGREILAPEIEEQEVVYGVRECKYGVVTPQSSRKIKGAKEPFDDAENNLALAMIKFIEGKIKTDYDDKNRYDCLSRFSLERAVERWEKVI